MMILSRIWYVVLALVVGVAIYVVDLAVGQYNRRNFQAMDELVKSDAQVVNWALQLDARRRLDSLLIGAVDARTSKAIKAASGKDVVPAAARAEGVKALTEFNDKLPADYKNDAVLLVDREGRLVAQVGYDAVGAYPGFELGGFPAVNDALHGYLRDDTWVLGDKIARIVTRPVEDEVGQPPLGAIVALRWLDASFAKELSKRTRASIAFFAGDKRVAGAMADDAEGALLEQIDPLLATLAEEKGYSSPVGRSDVMALGKDERGGAMFLRLPGDAWVQGAGLAVARPRVSIGGPLGFITGADDKDKASVHMALVLGVVVLGALIGMVLSYFEHSRPMKEMVVQALRLRKGEIDALQPARFRGGYRPIAVDLNAGIERVVEKGGGVAAKPADLAQILGPTSGQPAMSAFSFPQDNAPPPPSVGAPPVAFAPPAPALTPAAPAAAPPPAIKPAKPPPPSGRNLAAPPSVRSPSDPGLGSSGASAAASPDGEDWQRVYDDFVRTKRECGENVDGLTYEKFETTLRKNRDQLVQKHGCKRVKFSVYVKDGKASLKATPVREA